MNQAEWLKISSVDEAVTKLAADPSMLGISALAALGAGVGGLGTLGAQAMRSEDEDDHPTTHYAYPAAQGALLGGATGAAAGYMSPSISQYLSRVMKKEQPSEPDIKYDFSSASPGTMANLDRQATLSQYNPLGGWGMDAVRRGIQDPIFAGIPAAGGALAGLTGAAALNRPLFGLGRTPYEKFSDPVAAETGLESLLSKKDDSGEVEGLNELIRRQRQHGIANRKDLFDARQAQPSAYKAIMENPEVQRYLSQQGMPWPGSKDGPTGNRYMTDSIRSRLANMMDKRFNGGKAQITNMRPMTRGRMTGRGIAGLLSALAGTYAGAATGNVLSNTVSPFGANARFTHAARPYQL